MKRAALLIAALAVAAGLAGCGPDRSVPPSGNPFAACPHGDAGRIKDGWLRPPDWWVCVSD